jgi:phospholipid-binding lipoprotein MlaA
MIRRLGALVVAVLVAGCAATPSRVDPLEPMNRALFAVNDVAEKVVIKPVVTVYTTVVPSVIRIGIANAFGNIEDLFSAINGLLQGKPDKAGNDLGRVMVNTMFGLGGFIDIASDAGIERGNEDFGQTFGVWGFGQGPYLFVPFFGPTTIRDGSGFLVRLAAGPVGFIPDVPVRNSLYGVGYVDLQTQAMDARAVVDTAALDRYRFIRNAYLQKRRYDVHDGKLPPEKEEDE